MECQVFFPFDLPVMLLTARFMVPRLYSTHIHTPFPVDDDEYREAAASWAPSQTRRQTLSPLESLPLLYLSSATWSHVLASLALH